MQKNIPFEKCLQKAKVPHKLPKKEYLESGNFPVVSQEATLISGYHNEQAHVFNVSKPVVIFGDHTQVLKYVDFDFVVGADGVKVLLPIEEIDTKYFYYSLQALMPKGKGYARHYRLLKELNIPIHPYSEQERIVAKLDTAFAEIDDAILKIEAKLVNSQKIYLNSIDEHFKKKSEAMKTSKLLEITSKIGSGATPKGGKAAYKTEGISLIRSMNVHDMEFKWKDLAKIDDAQADKLSNVEICKNDVLLNITGASVARCCVVEEAALPARVNQHVAIIRPLKGTVLPNYLAYLLVSKTYKDLLLSVGEGGGATRQAITKAEIEQFGISYPLSINEQASIVEKFDKLREQALILKANYEKQINEFQSLKSAILAQELKSEAA